MPNFLASIANLVRRWWRSRHELPPYPLSDWSEMPETEWPQWYREQQEDERWERMGLKRKA